MKNSRQFLSTNIHDPVLISPATCQNPFSEWAVDYFHFNLLQVFAIDIDISWKQFFLTFLTSREMEINRKMTPRHYLGELN